MNLSNFSERLSELVFDTQKTLTEIGNELGCGEPILSKYLKGDCLPSTEAAIRLADYFQCSVDYLLGLEDESRAKTFKQCPDFSIQFVKLCEHFHMSRYALQKKTNISESVMRYWVRGKTKPNLVSVAKIAKAFDCSVDFVLGRES